MPGDLVAVQALAAWAILESQFASKFWVQVAAIGRGLKRA